MIRKIVGMLAVGLMSGSAASNAANLIVNGDFETGNFTGWTVTDQAGGSGSWYIDAPGSTTPVSGGATQPNASGGNSYAVTDQVGPGTHVLTQSFAVAPASGAYQLSFQMFVNDQSGLGPIGQALDFTVPGSQFARVDLLAPAEGPFSTTVLQNFYLGVGPGPLPNPWLSYVFDISASVAAGGNFILRFAEVDNQLFFNMGIDNVSITPAPVPLPAAAWLLLSGLGGLGFLGRRRKAV